jgi:hypothetical protein
MLLREAAGQTLQWRRPHFFSSRYELFTGDRLLASLDRTGILRQRAMARTGEQQWIFQREGLMGRRVVIYPGGPGSSSGTDELGQALASIQPRWNGTGTLTFYDGRVFTWTRTGNWRPVWSWVGSDNNTVLSMKRGRLLEIAPMASNLPEVALLSLLGLYMILIREADEAAAAAAV